MRRYSVEITDNTIRVKVLDGILWNANGKASK